MEDSFSLAWDDATSVVQSEEVITMENEIIPSQSEEFIGDVQEETYVETVQDGELVDDVGVVEEEVRPRQYNFPFFLSFLFLDCSG